MTRRRTKWRTIAEASIPQAAIGATILVGALTLVSVILWRWDPSGVSSLAPSDVAAPQRTLAQLQVALVALGIPLLVLTIEQTRSREVTTLNAPAVFARQTRLILLIPISLGISIKIALSALYLNEDAVLVFDLLLFAVTVAWIAWAFMILARLALQPRRLAEASFQIAIERIRADIDVAAELEKLRRETATAGDLTPLSQMYRPFPGGRPEVTIPSVRSGTVRSIKGTELADYVRQSSADARVFAALPGDQVSEGDALLVAIDATTLDASTIRRFFTIVAAQDSLLRPRFVDDLRQLTETVLMDIHRNPQQFVDGLTLMQRYLEELFDAYSESLSRHGGPSRKSYGLEMGELLHAARVIGSRAAGADDHHAFQAVVDFHSTSMRRSALRGELDAFRTLLHDLVRLMPNNARSDRDGLKSQSILTELNNRFTALAYTTERADIGSVVSFQMRRSILWEYIELIRLSLDRNDTALASMMLADVDGLAGSRGLGAGSDQNAIEQELDFVAGLTIALLGHQLDRRLRSIDSRKKTLRKLKVLVHAIPNVSLRTGFIAGTDDFTNQLDYWQSTISREGGIVPDHPRALVRGFTHLALNQGLAGHLGSIIDGDASSSFRNQIHDELHDDRFVELLKDIGHPEDEIATARAKPQRSRS